jgi:LysM repeat protein
VEAGQSLWAIAIAYKITIKDIQTWNNLAAGSSLQIGQRLFIPTSNTEGYATPTPIGMVRLSKPDRDGKVVHTSPELRPTDNFPHIFRWTVTTVRQGPPDTQGNATWDSAGAVSAARVFSWIAMTISGTPSPQ